MFSHIHIEYGLIVSAVTTIVINRCNYHFKHVPAIYPPNLRQSNDSFKQWKWRNFLISFIHSIITGFGSLICVVYQPDLLIDVTDAYLEMAYLLTSLSHGYFVHDLIDMLSHLDYKGSKELVIHHILILSCFSLTVTQKKYCGYSSIALLIELSNILLHFRQLLLLSDTPKSAPIYNINRYVNISFYVVVRGVCLFWLWLTLIWVLPKVPTIPKIIAFITLIGIGIMTIVLFMRIYRSDFAKDNSRKQKSDKSGDKANGFEQKNNGLVINPKDMHSKSS